MGLAAYFQFQSSGSRLSLLADPSDKPTHLIVRQQRLDRVIVATEFLFTRDQFVDR